MTTAAKLAVVLLYKRDTQPDERLVRLIQSELASRGCSVFIDRHLNMGVEWAREIETRIRSADAIIPLLSADSIQSEMLAFEIDVKYQTRTWRTTSQIEVAVKPPIKAWERRVRPTGMTR